ncbi:hypothetical protein ES319_A01G083800v1 [Gossypium barbadense]|uniref:Uncharacterized protein n=2 Tax=Gossypium TaxID=3633 RepID=A0A2P5XB88_GOSBA|nr:hypothetical protein ES319_A01G083800v1 [Gossypium barbadense]PPS00599.1 hypothetical protein GOBAR_AA20056 [Gossypium barbadense]TYH30400.1 hypothetical protein ES288_A01G091900v1 [Gossypium darwinii]
MFDHDCEGFATLNPHNPYLSFDFFKANKDSRAFITISVYGMVLLTWRGRSWGVTRSLPEASLFGAADSVCGAWEWWLGGLGFPISENY